VSPHTTLPLHVDRAPSRFAVAVKAHDRIPAPVGYEASSDP